MRIVTILYVFIIHILGQPRITTVTSRIKNTTLTLEWSIADASDCIDYFIVEMFNVHSHASSNEPLQFQEVYRGSETIFKREYLPYNNEVTCRVAAVNFMGKSKASAVFSGMTTKGKPKFLENFISIMHIFLKDKTS